MRMNERMKKLISALLCLCMLVQNAPVVAFAAQEDCTHHTEHTAECGYMEAVEGQPCTHSHDTAVCGYVEAVEEVPCACAETDENGALVHTEGCGYTAPVAGSDCTHVCDTAECGYVAAAEGHECHYECAECAAEQTDPSEATEPSVEPDQEAVSEEPLTAVWVTAGTDADLPDNDELFAMYAEQEFYGYEMATFGTKAGARLTGDEKLAYDALAEVIQDIASGERVFTAVSLGYGSYEVQVDEAGTIETWTPEIQVEFTESFEKFNYNAVVNALLADFPYEMYWYDKSYGAGCQLLYLPVEPFFVQFYFSVAGDYSAGAFQANTGKTAMAANAAANARAVAQTYEGKSDYEKLGAFKEYICDAVSYNHGAIEGDYESNYGDPWQMIYVFDEDPSTNVVCEGYSKALQYLCDQSGLDCISVIGMFGDEESSGAHMWNIVTLDDNNYLVDLTNSDEGTAGQDGELFLAGNALGSVADGYTFAINEKLVLTYTYSPETTALWDTSELTLAAENYEAEQPGEGDQSSMDRLTVLNRRGMSLENGSTVYPGDILRASYSGSGTVTLNWAQYDENDTYYQVIGNGAEFTVPVDFEEYGIRLDLYVDSAYVGSLDFVYDPTYTQYVASVICGTSSIDYSDFEAAVSAACAADGATLKLLDDLVTDLSVVIDGPGEFTLDLNGKSVIGESEYQALQVQDATVTIIDSSQGGSIVSQGYFALLAAGEGYVTVDSGIIGGAAVDTDSKLTVRGGTFSVSDAEEGTAYIQCFDSDGVTLTLGEDGNGAAFLGGLKVFGVKLSDLLDEGLAYWQEDSMVILEEDQAIIYGDVTIDTACSHEGITGEYVDNEDDTHSVVCTDCNATITEEHEDGAVCEKCGAVNNEWLPENGYPIWVSGMVVTADNADDVLGDGTVSYNSTTNTLTLNGAVLETSGDLKAAIYSKIPVNVEVEGTNTITADGHGLYYYVEEDFDTTISGTGTLTVNSGDRGIYVENVANVSMTITGSLTLNLNTYKTGIRVDAGEMACVDLTVEDAVKLNIDTTYLGGDYEGIYLEGVTNDLLVKDAVSIAIGSQETPIGEECIYLDSISAGSVVIQDTAVLSFWNTDEEGIYVAGDEQAITITGGTVDIHVDYEALDANTITISGGTVTACGGMGIYANDLTITGGSVTAAANNSSEGILAGNVQISGGTVSVTNGGMIAALWDGSTGTYGPGSITLGAGMSITEPEGGKIGKAQMLSDTVNTEDNTTDAVVNADDTFANAFTICQTSASCAHTYDNACDTDCNECGDTREVGDHTFDSDGKCDCGVRSAAKVGETYYLTLADAASNVAADGTITLLTDVTIAEGETINFPVFVTLDANGNTITCNGTVTIGTGEDVKEGIIFENTLYYYGGNVTNSRVPEVKIPTWFRSGEGYIISRYDSTTGTTMMRMHDATVTAPEYDTCGTQSKMDIRFSGTSTLTGNQYGIYAAHSGGVYDVIFTGENDAVLTIIARDSSQNSIGIRAKSVTINGGTVNIISGDATGKSVGINEASVTINGGTVNITSGNAETSCCAENGVTVAKGATLNLTFGEAEFAYGAILVGGEGAVNGLVVVPAENEESFSYSVSGNTVLIADFTVVFDTIPIPFTVPAGTSLTVNEGVTLDLRTLKAEDIDFSGQIINNGTIKLPEGFAMNTAPEGGTITAGDKSYTWDENNDKWICGENSHIFDTEGHCTMCFAPAAAKIGTTFYGTLAEAAEQAAENDTVYILTDVETDEAIAFAAFVTLDVAEGKTITCTGHVTIGGAAAVILENKLYLDQGDMNGQRILLETGDTKPVYWKAGKGYAVYDGSGTLLLNNAVAELMKSYDGNDSVIHINRDVVIEFHGTNSLTWNETGYGQYLIFNGDHKLTLKGSENARLNIETNKNYGVSVLELEIVSGTVTVTAGDDFMSMPVVASGDITIGKEAVLNSIARDAAGYSVSVGGYGDITVYGELNTAFGSVGANGLNADIMTQGGALVVSGGQFNGLALSLTPDGENGVAAYTAYGDAKLTADLKALTAEDATTTFSVPAGTSLTVIEGVTLDLSAMQLENIDFSSEIINHGRILLPDGFDMDNAPNGGTVTVGNKSYTWDENNDKWICGENSHIGGTATCTEQAKCDICGAGYGGLDPDNHSFTDVSGVCACGHVCPHEDHSQEGCTVCNAEKPHTYQNHVCACGLVEAGWYLISYPELEDLENFNSFSVTPNVAQAGTTVTVEAKIEPGYRFEGLTVVGADEKVIPSTVVAKNMANDVAQVTFVMPAQNVRIDFEDAAPHSYGVDVTLIQTGEGTVMLPEKHQRVPEYGWKFTVTPAEGYELVSLTLTSDVPVPGASELTQILCDKNENGEYIVPNASVGDTVRSDMILTVVFCSHSFAQATPNADGNTHNLTCETCGKTTADDHTTTSEATCVSKAFCSVCGEYGEKDLTNHVTGCTVTYSYLDAAVHKVKYSKCGTELEPQPHNGGTATCTAQAVCADCSVSYGSFAEHDTGYIADDTADTITSRCANCSTQTVTVSLVIPTGNVYGTEFSNPYAGGIPAEYVGETPVITIGGSGMDNPGNWQNAGEYEVTMIWGGQTVTGNTSFIIAKADPTYEIPANLTAAYGDTLADVKLPTGFAWTDAAQSVGNVGTHTFTAAYTPADTDNYNVITGIVISVQVTPKAVTSADITVSGSYTYTGKEIKPAVTVAGYAANTDYDVAYSDNVNAGTATVTVSFKGNYSGTKEATFEIVSLSLVVDGELIDDVTADLFFADETVSGTICYKGEELTEDDYDVTGNFAAKTATITFKGNYSGESTVSVTSVKKAMTDGMFIIDLTDKSYTGNQIRPEVRISAAGVEAGLTDADYEVIYGTNTRVGTTAGDITITGKGNFYGSFTKIFMIKPATLSVQPKEFAVTVGGEMPTFELVLSGVVPNDREAITLVVTYTPVFTIRDKDGNPIKDAEGNELTELSAIWDAIKSKAGAYQIVWTNPDMSQVMPDGEALGNYRFDDLVTQAALTINKEMAPAIVWPDASRLVYGQKLSESVLTSSDANGTFAWEDGTIVPTVTNSGYTVVYTPKDTENYDYSDVALEKTIAVTVDKADPAVTLPTGLTAVYGQTLADVNLPDGWTWADAAASVGTVGTHTFAAVFTPDDTANYNTRTENLTVNVDQKAVSEPVVTGTYTYTGSEQTVTLNGVESCMNIVSGNKGTNAGTYEVVITLNSNHKWEEGSDGKVQWTIAKAKAAITVDTTAINVTYGETVTLPEATTNFGTVACDKTAADLVNAGTYTVTYSVAGTDNYDGDAKTLTVSIGQKAVAEPTVTGTYTYTGKEQTAALNGFESGCMTIASGSKGTDAGGYEVEITLDGNYKWAEGSDGKVQWTIAKAKAAITVDTTAINVTYGETVTLPEATTNFGTVTCDKTAADLVNAGTYTVTYSVAGTGNYDGDSKTVTVTVKTKPITAADVALNGSLTYTGEELTQPITVTEGITYEVTGNKASNVGSYELTVKGIGNYTGEVKLTWTIKEAAAKLTRNPAAKTLTYTGKAQTLAEAGATADGKLVYSLSENGTYAETIPTGMNAGQYTVWYYVQGDANHSDSAKGSVAVTIAKTPLSVTARDNTITYGDAPAANGVDYEGFVNGETADVLGGELTCTCSYQQYGNVGDYTITPAGLTADNYTITFNTGKLTVSPAAVTVKAASVSKTYGEADPALTYTVSGLVNGDPITVVLERAEGENVGTYAISQKTLDAGKNYTITYTGADLTIAKRNVTVTAKDQTITYGDSISGTEYTVTNLVSGHNAAMTLTAGTAKVTANSTITPSVVITADGVDVTANYAVTYVPGALVIQPDTAAIDELTTENVTSANEADIQAVRKMMDEADSIREDWAAITENCQTLLEKIQEVEAENDRIGTLADKYDLESVKSSDEADLEALKEDIEKILATDNLTDEERNTLEGLQTKLTNLLARINGTQDLLDQLESTMDSMDKATAKSTDKATLEQVIEDAQNLIDSEYITETEREALKQMQDEAEKLIQIIEDTAEAKQEAADAADEFDADAVKSTDKAALEDLTKDIQDLLDTTNLTEDERKALEELLDQVKDMIDTIRETAEKSKEASVAVDAVDPETVTSADKDTLQQAIDTIDALLKDDHLTETEREELTEAKTQAEDLLDTIQAVKDALDTDNTTKVEDVTEGNVELQDKKDLEAAKADLEKVLADNGSHYTEDEKQAIQDEIARIDAAIQAVERVESLENDLHRLPGSVEPDDEAMEKKILAAKAAYDAMTEHEKSLVDRGTVRKLNSLIYDLTDYKIVRGADGKWMKGDNNNLTFTANGPFRKFVGIEVDGRPVRERNYTAKAGSTIITLKGSYLKGLEDGLHTLTVKFQDGEISCSFRILPKTAAPATGDVSDVTLWTSGMITSALALAIVLLRKKKSAVK